jgi:hypothetical protein
MDAYLKQRLRDRAVLEGEDDDEVDALYTDDIVQEAAEEVVGEAAAQAGEEEVFGGEDELDRAARIMSHSDQLVAKARIRHEDWKSKDTIANFVRINPTSVLKGVLGNQVQVTSGQQIKEVCRWAGDDAETVPVTILVAPVQQQLFSGPTSTSRPFAIITWGSKGFSVKAKVDIGQGFQLTLNASSVVVQVGLEASTKFPTPISQFFTGMLSFYPPTRVLPVTCTVYIDDLVGGGVVGQSVLVPAFAKNVIAWREDESKSLTLDFQDSNTHDTYIHTIPANTIMDDPIGLSNDTYSVIVEATGGAQSSVRLIYGLSL